MNTNDSQRPQLLKGVFARVRKHSANFYPLEVYGFVVGTKVPPVFCAVLPTGNTTKEGDVSQRFGLVTEALTFAEQVTKSFGFEILGLYHSHSDRVDSSPQDCVPDLLRDRYIVVNKVWGGEASLLAMEIHLGRQSWHDCDLPKLIHNRLEHFNPKKLHAAWLKLWQVNLSRTISHETPLPNQQNTSRNEGDLG